MGFNARWELEGLAETRNATIADILKNFLDDFNTLARVASVYALGIVDNGNHFILKSANGERLDSEAIPSEPGFYSIFTPQYITYLGEARDLRRRLFHDPDNTADSRKRFNGQGRAILKYLMHNRNLGDVGITDLLVQVYPASLQLQKRQGYTFGLFYELNTEWNRKSFEGILTLVGQAYHKAMVDQAIKSGFITLRSTTLGDEE